MAFRRRTTPRTGDGAGPHDGPPKPERAIRIARRGTEGSEEILQGGKDKVSRRSGKECLHTDSPRSSLLNKALDTVVQILVRVRTRRGRAQFVDVDQVQQGTVGLAQSPGLREVKHRAIGPCRARVGRCESNVWRSAKRVVLRRRALERNVLLDSMVVWCCLKPSYRNAIFICSLRFSSCLFSSSSSCTSCLLIPAVEDDDDDESATGRPPSTSMRASTTARGPPSSPLATTITS
mgnify:CR=1 FL=1|jgi:hypothetical protein